MKPFENKLNGIKTTLGDIQEVTEYLIGRTQEKPLDELKFEGREDLTFFIEDLKRDVEQLESMFGVTGLSRRYEIQKDEHGVECIHFLE
ncbi:hypothetical protein ACUWON_000137 [Salmonella enterica]